MGAEGGRNFRSGATVVDTETPDKVSSALAATASIGVIVNAVITALW